MASDEQRPSTRQGRLQEYTASEQDEPSRLDLELQRTFSAQFFDDHSVYHQQRSQTHYEDSSDEAHEVQEVSPAAEKSTSKLGKLSDADIDLEKQQLEDILGSGEVEKGAIDSSDDDKRLKLSKTKSGKSTVDQQLTLSVFVLAYAIAPLFVGPLSEVYGRVPIIQLSNLFYLVFNTACGASKTKAQMIVFRFLAGAGGAAPLALGGGVLSDVWVGLTKIFSLKINSQLISDPIFFLSSLLSNVGKAFQCTLWLHFLVQRLAR
ncbi:hypothetical protein ABW20_dc0104976 [Dactylellina cionopaga]|nr:hypothetical protein ABW20_dc0104976 [Dactylellina cionopaga]